MNDVLKKYIQQWQSADNKPCNDDVFIDNFVELLPDCDDRDFTFDGEGAYFGKQVTFHLNSGTWIGDDDIYFEIAYNNNHISIYTAKHHGFWTPEFVSVTSDHSRFGKLRDALFVKLRNVFGLSGTQ